MFLVKYCLVIKKVQKVQKLHTLWNTRLHLQRSINN